MGTNVDSVENNRKIYSLHNYPSILLYLKKDELLPSRHAAYYYFLFLLCRVLKYCELGEVSDLEQLTFQMEITSWRSVRINLIMKHFLSVV